MKRLALVLLLLATSLAQLAHTLHFSYAETTVTLMSVADNYVDSKYPRSNYGQGWSSVLYVGNSYDRAQDLWGSERIYVRFNLSGLPKDAIITHATLWLWQFSPPAMAQELEAYRVLEDWNETTQNWEDQPRWANQSMAATIAPSQAEVAVEWDITSDAAAWHRREAPDYGTMIKVTTETRAQNASCGFWSREYPVEKWTPKLIISFRVTSADWYVVKLKASGIPTGTNVTLSVDGERYDTLLPETELEVVFAARSVHTISVNQFIFGDEGTRYRCESNETEVSGPESYVFLYVTEYLVSFLAKPENMFEIPQSGWYLLGSSAAVNRTGPDLVNTAPQTRLAFDGWYINSQKFNETPACTVCPGPKLTRIVVNGPMIVEGRYRTEYYLNVTSPIGKTEGTGWYADGAIASFSIEQTQVPMEGLLGRLGGKRSFVEWTGSENILGLPIEPTGTVVVKEPTAIQAVWAEDWSSFFVILALLLAITAVAILILSARRRRSRTASN